MPIHLSDTLIIEDRLPPGAAAVLIIKAHTDTDIYLPINPAEKQIFDAIDGLRTVREIVEYVQEVHPGQRSLGKIQMCDFLERLWKFDQIVFDTTHK